MDERLARGYIATKNKVPLQKFKDGAKLLTLSQAEELDEYAMVLADGVVLIDVDDKEQAETLYKIVRDLELNCQVVETDRGKHFYFLKGSIDKCGTGINLAIGIKADIKLGSHNSLSIIKKNGLNRKILRNIDTSRASDVPYFLLPVLAPKNQLFMMCEGDGRDSTLYAYTLNLTMAKYSSSEIREIVRLINTYVFSEPLDNGAIERITREESLRNAIEKTISNGKKTDARLLSDLMIARDNIIIIDGEVYIYDDQTGAYSSDKCVIEKRMLDYVSKLQSSPRKEVLSFLKLNAPKRELSDKRYILFKNGVYDLWTDSLRELSPEYVILNQIPHNYNPDADGTQIWNAMYDWSCDDEAVCDLLEEVLGYCLLRENSYRKFFIIFGDKRNGKSLFLDCAIEMLGECNVSNTSLEELGERFKNTTLRGKLANIGDDIGDARISNTAVLKKLVSGETVMVERKGQDPVKLNNYATPIFSANKIPQVDDPTGAVRDRMVLIPFNAHFEEDDVKTNPFLKDSLLTEDNMEYLLVRAVEGLKRVLRNKRFTLPECVVEAMDNHDIESNPSGSFIRLKGESLLGRVNAEVYRDYELFCQEHNLSLGGVTPNKLTKMINRELRCECVPDGKGKRIYRR